MKAVPTLLFHNLMESLQSSFLSFLLPFVHFNYITWMTFQGIQVFSCGLAFRRSIFYVFFTFHLFYRIDFFIFRAFIMLLLLTIFLKLKFALSSTLSLTPMLFPFLPQHQLIKSEMT